MCPAEQCDTLYIIMRIEIERASITQNKYKNTIKQTKINKKLNGNVVHTSSKNENEVFIEHSTKQINTKWAKK